jgi:hypothetical protein
MDFFSSLFFFMLDEKGGQNVNGKGKGKNQQV